MEKDDEVSGVANTYGTFYRIYDARIARFTSLDPKMNKYSNWSPYAFSFNNPIYYKDAYGDDPLSAVIEAAFIFGLDISIDYLGARVLEGMTHEQALKVINWSGATYDAGETVIISAFFSGAGTKLMLNKIRKNKIAKIGLEVADELKDIMVDKFTNGDFDDEEGNFSWDRFLDKDEWADITLQILARKLIKYGYKKAAKSIERKVRKANKKAIKKQRKYDKTLMKWLKATSKKKRKRLRKKLMKRDAIRIKAKKKLEGLLQSKNKLDAVLYSEILDGSTNKVSEKIAK